VTLVASRVSDTAIPPDPSPETTSPASVVHDGRERMRVDCEIRAVRDDSGVVIVSGIAYPALRLPTEGKLSKADTFRIDSYRTWMSPETLRTFAHRMLERGTGGIDSQHDHGNVGCIVESHYQSEASSDYPADAWVVAVKVLKADAIEEIRTGKITGFSIEFTGRYKEAPLDVEGVGRVKTNEIVDPYPLTLSLVDKPAIRLPFASVEARADAPATPTLPEARTAPTHTTDHDGPGVTVLVRYAPDEAPKESPMPPETDATPDVNASLTPETAPAAAATTTSEARAEAPAQTPTALDPATLKRAVRETMLRSAYRAPVEATEADATRLADAMKRAMDYTSLASVWDAYSADWQLRDACRNAMYAAESVMWEVLYDTHGPETVTKLRQIPTDLAVIFEGICGAFEAAGGTAEERAARAEEAAKAVSDAVASVRAGKKLSKASRERIQKAHDSATGCVSELRAMLDETAPTDGDEAEAAEKAEDHEGEEAVDAKSATPATEPATKGTRAEETAPSTSPVTPTAPTVDVAALIDAKVREALAAHEADVTKLRSALAEKDAALVAETSAKDAAEKRAKALEEMRPAARSGLEESSPNDAAKAPKDGERGGASEPRSEGFGGILGIHRFAGIAPR